MAELELALKYEGARADEHQLDFYDAAIALVGFQRSLALTTHFVLHNEVITQAPALRGAQILAIPPEPGSWKITAAIVAAGATAIYQLGTAPRDTPLGNLVSSTYDYVVSTALGFHVDYDKTLGQQLEERRKLGLEGATPTKGRLDSVVEKAEPAIRDMHRPIVISHTAESAMFEQISPAPHPLFMYTLSQQTFDHMKLALPGLETHNYVGRVSSYNLNTFRGRIFLGEAERPVPFEVAEAGRTPQTISAIARSLASNAGSRRSAEGLLHFSGRPIETRTGRLKSIALLSAI